MSVTDLYLYIRPMQPDNAGKKTDCCCLRCPCKRSMLTDERTGYLEIPRSLHDVHSLGNNPYFGVFINSARIGQSGVHIRLLFMSFILDKHCDSIAKRNMFACSWSRSISKYLRHKSGKAQYRKTIRYLKSRIETSSRRCFRRRRIQNNFSLR